MALSRVMTLGRMNTALAKDLASLGPENMMDMASARWYLTTLPFYLGN